LIYFYVVDKKEGKTIKSF